MVAYGGNQGFAIAPSTGYHVADLVVDGLSVGAVTTYTFTNITANHTIAASFTVDTFAITATAGTGGSIAPSGTVTVGFGGSQGFAITPSTGYHVADVLVDGVSVGAVSNDSFSNVTANHTIAASFATDVFTITASAGPGGAIAPSGAVTVASGASQSFAIAPSTGYHVADVLVDGLSVGAVTSYNFTNVTANHTIADELHNRYIHHNGDGGYRWCDRPIGGGQRRLWREPGVRDYAEYRLPRGDVLVDGVSAGAITNYTFSNVTANHTIAPSFTVDTFTITATAGTGGSIAPPGAVTVGFGGSQAFTITPSTGYHVADVLVDGVSAGAITSFTFTNVTGNHTIAASFAINTFTITATAGANGAITPSGAVTVGFGGSQAFTITPSTGYHVADVLVDGVSAGAVTSYTFTNVTANHTIAASFAVDMLTIAASAGAGGAIDPSGSVTVAYGGSQSFAIAPSTGYHVVDVLVDGLSVGAMTSHTFTNVTANHTIAASFAVDMLTIAASAGAGGTIDPSGAVTVAYGANQSFAITASAGYHVADVLVDGLSVGVVTSYSFTNVTANHTIAASFATDIFTITASAGSGGAIAPSGAVGVNYGGSQAFAITPSTGYHVADVLVDGVSAGAVTSYTFNNVTANHTIAPSFAVDTLTITATAGANGAITPSGAVGVTMVGARRSRSRRARATT